MLNGIENIEGLTPEQVEAINGLAAPILSKRDELLEKLSKTKTEVNTSASELERLKAFEAAALKEQEEAKGNYQSALELSKAEFEKNLALKEAQIQEKEQALTKLLINDGLNKALDGVGINPALKAGAEAMLLSQAQLVEGKAMIGEKSLSDAVKEWSESDMGKSYCLAQPNQGGEASGGGGRGDNKPMTLTERAIAANKSI